MGIGNDGPIEMPVEDALMTTVVLGTSGGGKTGLLNGVALQAMSNHENWDITIFDPKRDMVPGLVTDFLPAAHGTLAGVDPASVLVIEPFGPYGVPMGLLAKDPTVDPAVQAYNSAHLVAGLGDGALGARMQHVLQGIFSAILAHPVGALVDAPRLLTNASYRLSYADALVSRAAADYLRVTFAEEPAATVSAVLARLDNLLVVPSIRAMIGGPRSIDTRLLVDGPRLVLVNLGGAPQGMLPIANLVGSFIFSKLTGAVFSRSSKRRRLIICDEWHVLAKHCPSDFERLISLARSSGCSLLLANQDWGQVRAASQLLADAAGASSRRVLFCPEPEDLASIVKLLEPTGRIVDPVRPDRLLDAAAERAQTMRRLSTMPRRHCVVVDRAGRGTFEMRTLTVPYEEARRRAAECGPALRDAYRRGSDGVPMSQLLAEVDDRNVDSFVVAPSGTEPAGTVEPAAASRSPRSRSSRPRLVVP